MSKSRKEENETPVSVQVEYDAMPNALVELPKPVVEVKPEPRRISIEQYAARKEHIRPQHIGGLRAFVTNPDKFRSEEEWDSLFKNY